MNAVSANKSSINSETNAYASQSMKSNLDNHIPLKRETREVFEEYADMLNDDTRENYPDLIH